jgi:hypothetical protein
MLLTTLQGGYPQPVLGINWGTHVISVGIPSSPSWARAPIEEAMSDWSQAQAWFIQTYFPGQTNAQFLFVATQNSGLVQVIYVNDTGQDWTGTTLVPISGTIVNETILVILSRVRYPPDLLQVFEHELGHVLGLDHTGLSQDLMYPARDASYGGEPTHPSTLNLYAVYLLGSGCSFSSEDLVYLPSQIPYLEWYPAIQQNNVGPIGIQPACPKQKTIWQQPWLVLVTTMALLIGVIVLVQSRRRKTQRPTKFMDA